MKDNQQNSLGSIMSKNDAPKFIYRAPTISAKVIAARKGHLGGKQHRDYLVRLDRARILLAQGLSNLDVAEAMGVAPNSVPALKRALGIEVKGFRKGLGTRMRSKARSSV